MKLARPSLKALAAAGASAAVIASGSAAYAIYSAASAPTASPAPSAAASPPPAQLAATGARANVAAGAKARATRRALGGLVIGEITSVSSTGGAASQGTISVRVPDGQTVTANLVKRTRVLAYQGPGTRPTTETLSQLHPNEMVAVRILRQPAAGSGSGTGPTASGTASAGSSALALTAASPGTASGPAYAALIVDLGYAVSS